MESSNQVQKINVDAIYDNRNDANSPYKTLQLRVERPRAVKNSNDVLSMFLGGTAINNTEKLVAFQTMHADQIKEFGIEEGDNLNEKLPQSVKLVVSEITASEYSQLEGTAQIPYRAKQIPDKADKDAGNYLVTEDGEYVYRGTLVTAANDESMKDTYVSHSRNTAEEPTVENTESSIDEVVTDDDLAH